MLHAGDDHLVAGFEVLAPVAAGHQVQPFGGPPHVDDLVGVRRVYESPHRFPSRLVVIRGALAQRMHPPVYVGVVMQVIVADCVNYGLGFLGSRRVVQIYQRLAVHFLVQDWKVLPDAVRVNDIQPMGLTRAVAARCARRIDRGGHWRPPKDSERSASGIALWNCSSRYSRSGSNATVSIISLAKA